MTASQDRISLFTLSFAAITATSFCFVLRALVVDSWGEEFALSATQKGELLGAGLWPFALAIVILSLFIDRIGFRAGLVFAALMHFAGLAVLVTAASYWMLYLGTFLMALGNGAVEVVANPLIATLFSEDRPRWLNRLHAAWPGGMILGGLLAIAMGDQFGWRAKTALMFVPVLIYAILLLRQRFPMSERVAAGIPYHAMIAEAGWMSAFIVTGLMTLEIGRVLGLSPLAQGIMVAVATCAFGLWSRSAGRPLYIVLVLLMIPLAITELSTDSWISSLLAPELGRIGFHSGWVLVLTAAVVFLVRLLAGSVIAIFGPFLTLALASGASAAGLYTLAGAHGAGIVGAAILYGIGKSFFWGTSLAIVSDRFPRGGAVTINVTAGVGMLAAGIVGSVLLGAVQDRSTTAALSVYDSRNATSLHQRYTEERPASILGRYRALDEAALAAAPASERATVTTIVENSKLAALRDVALLPVLTMCAYLALALIYRRRRDAAPVGPLSQGTSH
ncbi:MFS transporter [Sphingobium sp.]|uniref:MFS transporter n=1 Tax=Sphingobium sp. TaxID=1912891 RepID=UPI0028BE8AC1|nr:MFS transporter [Sphingobium sp.]